MLLSFYHRATDLHHWSFHSGNTHSRTSWQEPSIVLRRTRIQRWAGVTDHWRQTCSQVVSVNCDTYFNSGVYPGLGRPDRQPLRDAHVRGSLGVLTFELDAEGTKRGSPGRGECSGSVRQESGKCKMRRGMKDRGVFRLINSSRSRCFSVFCTDRGHLNHWPGTSYWQNLSWSSGEAGECEICILRKITWYRFGG